MLTLENNKPLLSCPKRHPRPLLEEVAHIGERRECHHFRNDNTRGDGFDQSGRLVSDGLRTIMQPSTSCAV
jgi:hypothetical protein